MRSRRRRQAVVLFSLAPLCALWAMACTPSIKGSRHQVAPLPLSNPTIITAGPVSLAVGTNHWSNPASGLEEAFFPVAVTVRNTGNQPLCGGVSTAALGDSAGASVSAIFPVGVVTRLFGPFASFTPMPQPAVKAAAFANRPLAPQEERSGFLFFPLPVPDVGSTVLTWGWYDCVTHALVAHLSMPIPVEKTM